MRNVQEEEERNYRPSTDAELDREDARERGEHRPEQAWILSDRDVWYPNPYYKGPDQRHPEEENYEEEEELFREEASLLATIDVLAQLKKSRDIF